MLKQILKEYLKASYIKYVTALVVFIFAAYDYWQVRTALNYQKTYSRQVNGYLSDKENELISQDVKFNKVKTTLVSNAKKLKEEASEYRSKYQKASKEYEQFVKNNKLVLEQYQNNVFTLKQEVKSLKNAPAKTKIVIEKGSCTSDTIVSYTYDDPTERLSFTTPNCLVNGNEVWSLNQAFSVYGEVHQQKNGALKVATLNLTELDPLDHSKILSKASLVKSEFKYVPLPIEKVSYDMVTFGLGINQKLKLNANIGYNLYSFRSFYLNAGAAIDTSPDAYPYLSIIYRPDFLSKPLNLGISFGSGYSLRTSFNYLLGVSLFAW